MLVTSSVHCSKTFSIQLRPSNFHHYLLIFLIRMVSKIHRHLCIVSVYTIPHVSIFDTSYSFFNMDIYPLTLSPSGA